MNLIEEANSKVILVCPYYRISKWYKLLNTLNDLKRRNVDVEFYVRENEHDSIGEVERAGFTPMCIPNLHTKLYLNERYGIVSSMNLLLSSENNSLEIAMRTETKEEYDELYQYYVRYLKDVGDNSQPITAAPAPTSARKSFWMERLSKRINDLARQESYIEKADNKLLIKASNRYEAFIWSVGKASRLRISGVLSSREYQYARSNMGIFQSSRMTIELQEGRNGHYDLIWGTMGDFRSQSMNELLEEEEEVVIDAIAKFIAGIESFKKTVR